MKNLENCANTIKRGSPIAFPTETVYGIGADAFNEDAVRKVFELKQRPLSNPLSLHIADIEQLSDLVEEIPDIAQELIEKYWPGPLTLIFKKSDKVPNIVTAGKDTVGIRLPDHDICRELIRQSGTVIVGTSANISGQPPCTDYQTTHKLFPQTPIVNGGECKHKEASTIIDVSKDTTKILRQGSIQI